MEAALAAQLQVRVRRPARRRLLLEASDPRPDQTLVPNVTIGDWQRPWNLKGDRALPGAPPAALWAGEPTGLSQVGCVYTAQGFDYDWNGVILGPDLVWRNGGFVSRREHNRDPDFRNTKTVSDLEFDRLVRNVYKVLRTRDMIGILPFTTDSEVHEAAPRCRRIGTIRSDAAVPAS